MKGFFPSGFTPDLHHSKAIVIEVKRVKEHGETVPDLTAPNMYLNHLMKFWEQDTEKMIPTLSTLLDSSQSPTIFYFH